MNERTGISELKGIGEKTEQLFHKLGIFTVGDLIRHYPRGYDLYEPAVPIDQLEEGKVQTVTGSFQGSIQVSPNRRMPVTTAQIRDHSGTIKAIWFRMPFLRNTFARGGMVTLRGQILRRPGGLVIEHPEIFYPADKYQEKLGTMQPRYSLTAGLTNNTVVRAMRQALEHMNLSFETLPEELRLNYHLAEYNFSLRGIHFPKDPEAFRHARERLVFEEFLDFILSIRTLQADRDSQKNRFSISPSPETERVVRGLPYQLTDAQKRVWDEICADMEGSRPMSRLIQGDVGSGKTIVAFLALLSAAFSGYQGAMMAPTEVLARQHYQSLTELIRDCHAPVRAELLTGSMTAREKREARRRIETGEVQIILGTHALIQDPVCYRSLALVITDEQHRFGVRQRESFSEKSTKPHILVMSATPIPRTLAMILYGDLDISVIDELPAGRLPIKNCVVDTDYRPTAYRFIRNQTAQGRQCYIICPMVEESEHLEAENVIGYTEMLKNELGKETEIAYLHGKMKQSLKDEIMERFAAGEIQILVSTTVVEVGINVPNATVMLIENADRFGLAQLHQLRGRIGRGEHQSYCIFMTGSKAKETKKRLEILNRTNDGFEIASEDLKLRGPGDLFGIRQSGLMEFRLGDVFQDASLLQKASEAAGWILKNRPDFMQKLEKNEKTASVIL